MRAEIYESVDKMKNGGTLYTRIYCFQTDKPILGEDCSVNKSENMLKQQKTKRRLFFSFTVYIKRSIKKWSLTFLKLQKRKEATQC
jgi:hypothetical protein